MSFDSVFNLFGVALSVQVILVCYKPQMYIDLIFCVFFRLFIPFVLIISVLVLFTPVSAIEYLLVLLSAHWPNLLTNLLRCFIALFTSVWGSVFIAKFIINWNRNHVGSIG